MSTIPLQRNSPYQGLIPYTEKDAQLFFGREKDTRLIIANLFASPLTLLYGPSGVGKSSVLRAGAVYQLSQRPDLRVVYNSEWKDNPLDRLKTVCAALPGIQRPPDFSLPLAEYLTECVRQLDHRLMVILDQFEEYFLYHPEVDSFTEQFSRAVIQEDSPISFLVSLREDGLAKLDRFEGRIPILFDNYLRLEHLDDDAARSAITKPVEKYSELYLQGKRKLSVEPALVDEVIRQLRSGRISLQRIGQGIIGQEDSRTIETPYLQLVMERIWNQENRRGSDVLCLATLSSLGGAEKIVKSHLDAVMRRLKRSQRVQAAKIMQYLVTPSGTKIALSIGDLASYAGVKPQRINPLLQRLSAQDIRLLRAVDIKEKKEPSYEIYHDVLAMPILDWRFRFTRSRRIYALAIPFIALLIMFLIVFGYYRALATNSGASTEGFEWVIACFVSFLCLLPMIFGFLVGRNWAQAR